MGVSEADIQAFIARWQTSGAAERANYQLFLAELCDLIEVEHPHPKKAQESENTYVFEKAVPSPHGTTNFIDLYKRGCFVLEAKQGSDQADKLTFSAAALQQKKQTKKGTAVRGTAGWDTAMEKARQQAQSYARNLPQVEIENGRPPFVIVVDVGNSIHVFSEFTRTGGNYVPFPDPNSYRLTLDDLHDANVRALLHTIWTDPMALDPSRRSARVTREIATRLAQLARSLEGQYDPELVAQFLMRCLFTMFAEDVGLLPNRSFMQLLADIRHDPASFKPMVEHLWTTMNTGGFSVILRQKLPQFNGGLFANPVALPLGSDQLQLLVEAAQADWRDVEPAIFGTLLERALNPIERHKLGAHYTPRAYVERLVQPTVIEPLRAEWESVQAAAALYADAGQPDKAIAEVKAFHLKLATLRVLDPACGSGNFLYVTLELMKRLEGEVLNTLRELGEGQMQLEIEGVMITPQQFLGIEVNPRAAAIAELVLWIGFLQWHLRTRGETKPPEPIIKNYHNIECRDAVLAWDAIEPLVDGEGRPVTRWDGRSTKLHPVTGEEVPDETARVPVYRYINPRTAEWPPADIVVGNPPFLGKLHLLSRLGEGYVEALRQVYKGKVPAGSDFVMYWWNFAAQLTSNQRIKRFGFITTNSITQTFNRTVVEEALNHKTPIYILFAIPDHPWVDSEDSAAVRIAMTVGEVGKQAGILATIVSEKERNAGEFSIDLSRRTGLIHSDLRIGPNMSSLVSLRANDLISGTGLILGNRGFTLTYQEAVKYREYEPGDRRLIFPLRNGHDLAENLRNLFVIDTYGWIEEELKSLTPEIYQRLFERVYPERQTNRDPKLRRYWWLFRRSNEQIRTAIHGLTRYIATPETAKHRVFYFLSQEEKPEHKLVVIGSDNAFLFGVLSSSIHSGWALETGALRGETPVYVKTTCFEKFPFPDATETQKQRIREIAEQLDAHRKRQQALHPKLTITDMYNVLEKLRAGEPLDDKDKVIHEQGLVSILKQLHDDLDTAVFDAYGWPPTLTDEEILQRLVDLNAERAAEEAAGHIRWLRPEYQAPQEVKPTQTSFLPDEEEVETAVATAEPQPWPTALKDRATAVRAALAALAGPADLPAVASAFAGKRTQKRLGEVEEILEMLVSLGQVVGVGNGRYAAG